MVVLEPSSLAAICWLPVDFFAAGFLLLEKVPILLPDTTGVMCELVHIVHAMQRIRAGAPRLLLYPRVSLSLLFVRSSAIALARPECNKITRVGKKWAARETICTRKTEG